MTRRLLVPLTDSEHAWPALEHALEFFPDATITVLTVVDPAGAGYGQRSEEGKDGTPTSADAGVDRLFEEAIDRAEEQGVTIETTVAEGRPARTIVEVAERAAVDQIVVGIQDHSGISRVLLGSVAETVAKRSPVSVTIVK
ncbi:universal stress protein UspA [Halobacteriales archaeon QS_3_64_16]|nr:MAG: universal stress protein UspA [Halobacteriales archaeon QS_3_64_16]